MNTSAPAHGPVYEIRVHGHLSRQRAALFSGMAMTLLADGSTRLRGPLPDQAALYGLLGRLRDMGLTLLTVQRLEEE